MWSAEGSGAGVLGGLPGWGHWTPGERCAGQDSRTGGCKRYVRWWWGGSSYPRPLNWGLQTQSFPVSGSKP